jgi:hypothetical protein
MDQVLFKKLKNKRFRTFCFCPPNVMFVLLPSLRFNARYAIYIQLQHAQVFHNKTTGKEYKNLVGISFLLPLSLYFAPFSSRGYFSVYFTVTFRWPFLIQNIKFAIFFEMIHIIVQSNLYIKGIQWNLKMCPLWAVALCIQVNIACQYFDNDTLTLTVN